MAKRTFLEWIQYTNSPHTDGWSKDWDIEFGEAIDRIVDGVIKRGICIESIRFKN